MTSIELTPIGQVNSEQGRFVVVVETAFRSALKELAQFSHLQLLWWADGCASLPMTDRLVAH